MPDEFALNDPGRNPQAFLERLIGLYYPEPLELGRFSAMDSSRLPQPFGMLLAHNRHMTVTVESFHGDSVDVEVLRSQQDGDSYSREILLRTQRRGDVVQYGIVRLRLHLIAEEPRREILQERKPLGRVLIEHQVLREVELLNVWQVHCGPALSRMLHVSPGVMTYGRTAMIHCDSEPAIELLEIVSPVHRSMIPSTGGSVAGNGRVDDSAP